MILIDDRAGSRELLLHMPSKTARLQRLGYGDVAFTGHGPPDVPLLTVGCELKTVQDCVACIRDGRFAGHQLPGLTRSYNMIYLLILNRIRPDQNGKLVYHAGNNKWRRPFAASGEKITYYDDFVRWLLTMEIQGGCRVWILDGYPAVARFVSNLHNWVGKPWEAHNSLHTFNNSREISPFARPTQTRLMAATLPGIGWRRSAAVAQHFPTPLDMVLADRKQWLEIEGIGSKVATAVHKALTKGK